MTALDDPAIRDPLTGTFAPSVFDTFDARYAAEPDASFGVCVVHMATLAEHRQAHGAPSADDALVRMARFLLRHSRAHEAVVRADTDTFALVLHDADAQATEVVARRLQLASLRTAPLAYQLGWAGRVPGEPIAATLARAAKETVPVRVIAQPFDRPRAG